MNEIRALQIDVIALIMMGLLVHNDGKIELAQYAEDSESFVHAANRLIEWASEASLPDLRAMIPRGPDTVTGDHDVAARLCKAVRELLDGRPVELEQMQQLESASVDTNALRGCSATQVVPPEPPIGVVAEHVNAEVQDVFGGPLTPQASFDGTGAPPPKRLRAEEPLRAEDFQGHSDLSKRIFLSILKSSQRPYSLAKNSGSFKTSTSPADVEEAMRLCFRLFCELGLGVSGSRGATLSLQKPPAVNMDAVMDGLKNMLNLPDTVTGKVRESLSSKDECTSFDMDR